MRCRINRLMLDLSTRWIVAEEVVAFPVLRWPNRPGNEPTATLGHTLPKTLSTHVAQNVHS